MDRRRFIKWSALAGLTGLAGGAALAAKGEGDNPYYSGPPSENFDGRLFFNPQGIPPRAFADLLRWQFGGGRKRWPKVWPSPFAPAVPAPLRGDDALRVTMVGHATLLVQAGGLTFLTDPVWSNRVSPVSFAGPRRVNEPGIAFEDLPRIDVVLLSHNHYDHFDVATLKRLKAVHDPLVVTPLGNDTILRRFVPTMRIHCGDWGDDHRLSLPHGEARIHIEPAHHWSARGTHDRRMALWCAFAVETAAGKLYYAGDTGFHRGINYRAAARKHGGFRLAVLPIGAYEPRWFMEGQHQNPQEAVEGMLLANAAHAAGCHWGTFQLTNEAVEEPREHLLAALAERGVEPHRFRPMLPGEVWDVPPAAV
jgi:L-ascorbate metabolism protein UlaG (beta-lactamase superfamily)